MFEYTETSWLVFSFMVQNIEYTETSWTGMPSAGSKGYEYPPLISRVEFEIMTSRALPSNPTLLKLCL